MPLVLRTFMSNHFVTLNQNNNGINMKHIVTVYITSKCELPTEPQFVSLKSHLAAKYDFHDVFHLQQ